MLNKYSDSDSDSLASVGTLLSNYKANGLCREIILKYL